ncbi:MAG: phosphatidate cytidylyltransferase [bacterium]
MSASHPQRPLLTRVLSAAVLVPLFLWINASGGLFFFLAVEVVWLLGARESARIFARLGTQPRVLAALVGTALLPIFLLDRFAAGAFSPLSAISSGRDDSAFDAAAVVLPFFAAAFLVVVESLFSSRARPISRALAGTFLTMLYPGVLGIFFFLLRAHEPQAPLYLKPSGAALTLFLALTTWGCDTFAYFGGRAFGRHKLAPLISPKKTWEGSLSGFLAASLLGWISALTYAPFWSPLTGLLLGAAMGVGGQLGDLAESALKRRASAKDAGAIIPGHGGILDRFDSFLLNGLILYALVLLLERAW